MIKKLTALLLVCVMSFGLIACGKEEEEEPVDLSLNAKPEERTITKSESEIIDNLESSVGLWEFAQSFFDDLIIYKSKLGTWEYAMVDDSLPKSDYNWDNLRHAGVIGGTEWEYYVDGELKSIKGIDLSVYNEVTDWDAVKADGVEFAMIRSGYRGWGAEGKFVEDENFISNAQNARNAGIEVGVYFVTQAVNVAEAEEEANWVLDRMKAAGVSFRYPVALDLEDAGSANARTASLTSQERTEIIKAFCRVIKEAGYEPMLYSNIRWYIEEMDLAELTDINKWFAQYFNKPFFPYEFQIWQYTNEGKVDGIKGNVDLNLCFVNYASDEETK